MLKSTFIHVPGVGYVTERSIWENGAIDWQQYLERSDEINISAGKKALIQPIVEESIQRLADGDHRWFAGALPAKEHWRALSEFGDAVGYLDIETSGCNSWDHITVIGLFDGYDIRQFICGRNMDEFPEAVSQCKMLVTFFGTGFDLPFIRRTFPNLTLDQLHIDLCHMFRRIGLTGGLKRIEHSLGISRCPEADGLDGLDAVRLWNAYRHGSEQALDTLLVYNKEDVVNMKTLLEYGCKRLKSTLPDAIFR
jgi:hypothetical protein